MSRISDYTTRLALAFTGVILTATLAAPATANAQVFSAEHVLLNRVAPALDFNTGFPVVADPSPMQDTDLITGASALLNRRAGRIEQQFDAPRIPTSPKSGIVVIDGERALLGQVEPAESRHEKQDR